MGLRSQPLVNRLPLSSQGSEISRINAGSFFPSPDDNGDQSCNYHNHPRQSEVKPYRWNAVLGKRKEPICWLSDKFTGSATEWEVGRVCEGEGVEGMPNCQTDIKSSTITPITMAGEPRPPY